MSTLRFYKLSKNDDLVVKTIAALRSAAELLEPRGQLYAFGSYATDSMTAASDLDVAFIVPDEIDTRLLYKNILKQLPRERMPLDLIILKRSEFENKSHIGGVCFDIRVEGLKLYSGAEVRG